MMEKATEKQSFDRGSAMSDTLVAKASASLQRDILSGDLAPSSRLIIQDLVQRYGIGSTPLREALSRLVSTGLIISIGQRGFRVAPLSQADLADITMIRTLIEVQALRLSMVYGDVAWEAGIVASLHRLRVFAERNETRLQDDDWGDEDIHKGFHTSLIKACNSDRMLEMHSSLYDQAYRYRKLMMKRQSGPTEFIRVHTELADLVISRRTEDACRCLEKHLHLTMDYVYPGK